MTWDVFGPDNLYWRTFEDYGEACALADEIGGVVLETGFLPDGFMGIQEADAE